MPKFIISYGLGDLDNCEIVEAKDLATAENIAARVAVEDAASESKAETYTRALALEYGLDNEETNASEEETEHD